MVLVCTDGLRILTQNTREVEVEALGLKTGFKYVPKKRIKTNNSNSYEQYGECFFWVILLFWALNNNQFTLYYLIDI